MGSVKRLLEKIKPTKPTEPDERLNNLSWLIEENERRKRLSYQPLYTAVVNGNWGDARAFLEKHPGAVTAKITDQGETALHVAARTQESIDFLRKLVEFMYKYALGWTDKNGEQNLVDFKFKKALGLTDKNGETALCVAARVGNVEAVKFLSWKHPELLYIWSNAGESPLHSAAEKGNKEIVSFLLIVTKDHIGHSPYAGRFGKLLLGALIRSKLYDAALKVVHQHAVLVTEQSEDSPLNLMAKQPFAFLSGCSLTPLRRLLYFCVPIKEPTVSQPNGGIQVDSQAYHEVLEDLYGEFWRAICRPVPFVKQVEEMKIMNYQAVKLVNYMCKKVKDQDQFEAIVKKPFLSAARNGIKEVVELILDFCPSAIHFTDEDQHDVLQLAILNHHSYIFCLQNQLSTFKTLATQYKDSDDNNILHLAARLAPDRLNGISSAASQMQSELQWFQEVKQLVPPSYKEMKNNKGQTPEMIFVEEHKNLVTKGEQWMKQVAISCTVGAAIVVTLAFAAIFLIGGSITSSVRYPYLFRQKAFTIFPHAKAFSLFRSSISMSIFLAILVSRYSHNGFLYPISLRLMIGVIVSYLSLSSMIFAFATTLYLAIRYGMKKTLIMVGTLACLVIGALIVICQFPTLASMILSGYC